MTAAGAAPVGTTIRFNPPTGTDTMMKSGVQSNINTRYFEGELLPYLVR